MRDAYITFGLLVSPSALIIQGDGNLCEPDEPVSPLNHDVWWRIISPSKEAHGSSMSSSPSTDIVAVMPHALVYRTFKCSYFERQSEWLALSPSEDSQNLYHSIPTQPSLCCYVRTVFKRST